MFKNIFILILIVVLVAIGAAASIKVIFWSIGLLLRVVFNLALVVAAIAGIFYLVRKLRA